VKKKNNKKTHQEQWQRSNRTQ